MKISKPKYIKFYKDRIWNKKYSICRQCGSRVYENDGKGSCTGCINDAYFNYFLQQKFKEYFEEKI